MPQVLAIPVRNDSIAVGINSVEVSETREVPNNMRRSILIRNNSLNAADKITLSLGDGSAVSGFGIVLEQGQSWSDSDDAGYSCHKGPIYAICATANGVIAIMER